jgi:hypothetical protein
MSLLKMAEVVVRLPGPLVSYFDLPLSSLFNPFRLRD